MRHLWDIMNVVARYHSKIVANGVLYVFALELTGVVQPQWTSITHGLFGKIFQNLHVRGRRGEAFIKVDPSQSS